MKSPCWDGNAIWLGCMNGVRCPPPLSVARWGMSRGPAVPRAGALARGSAVPRAPRSRALARWRAGARSRGPAGGPAGALARQEMFRTLRSLLAYGPAVPRAGPLARWRGVPRSRGRACWRAGAVSREADIVPRSRGPARWRAGALGDVPRQKPAGRGALWRAGEGGDTAHTWEVPVSLESPSCASFASVLSTHHDNYG